MSLQPGHLPTRYEKGVAGEWIAAWLLRFKGYRILAQRFKSGPGEIDLIARRRRTLAFVEVKARPSLREGLEAVTPRQRQRICRAAAVFLSGRPGLAGYDQRFDIIVVRPWAWPLHVANAWQAEHETFQGHPFN